MARHECLVFGANLAGRHGAGSALWARQKWGAIPGSGVGFQSVCFEGDAVNPARSSYAIPTKDRDLKVLPLDQIRDWVGAFLVFSGEHPEITFRVVAIGCGLAGFRPDQVAPMFACAPANCELPREFKEILEKQT